MVAEDELVVGKLGVDQARTIKQMLSVVEQPIRPSFTKEVTPGISLIGVGNQKGELHGVAVVQDFGVRVLLSDVFVVPAFRKQGLGRLLMIHALESAPPNVRILAATQTIEQSSFLTHFGFEVQPGEYFMKLMLDAASNPLIDSGSLELPKELLLEIGGHRLISDAVSLWNQEQTTHLAAGETFQQLNTVCARQGEVLGLREASSGNLVAAILLSAQGAESMLYHLYVVPQYRGRGLGTRLAHAAILQLLGRGCASALLCVHAELATRFWAKLGFTPYRSSALLQFDPSSKAD